MLRGVVIGILFLSVRLLAQSPLDSHYTELSCKGFLSECLQKIESQSEFRFSFKQADIGKLQCNIELKSIPIREVLDTICRLHQLQYEVFDQNKVILTRRNMPSFKPFTMVGLVLDANSGEVIPDANIYESYNNLSTISDKFGFFRFVIRSDSVSIHIEKEQYQLLEQNFKPGTYRYYIFKLHTYPKLQELVVKPLNNDTVYINSKPYVEINPATHNIPGVGGERDAISNMKLKSGIQNVGMGDPGLIVRGGGPDQNFILIDGIPVYNTFHLMGLYSIFNSSTINSIKLYKDAFPSKYGSRLSSVVDVNLNNGNKQKFSGDADIGIISSGLSFNGPLKKDKLSFSVGVRRTYADLLTYPVQSFLNKNEIQKTTTSLWYYDIFTKLHYQPGTRSQFKLTLYNGGDELNFNTKLNLKDSLNSREETEGNLKWRNTVLGLQWHYYLNEKTVITAQSAYSSYKVQFSDEYNFIRSDGFQHNRSAYSNGLSEIRNTLDFEYFAGNNNLLHYGLGFINYRFNPFRQSYTSESRLSRTDTIINTTEYISNEIYVYLENSYYSKLGAISVGLRVSGFNTSSRQYFNIQPRVFVTQRLNKNYQIRFSLTDIGQFLHLLPNNNLGLPVDIWLPVTDEIEPLRSFQLSAGIKAVQGHFSYSFGLFGKNYRNLIENQAGSNFILSTENWKSQLEIGSGVSYGAELNGEYKTTVVNILGAYTYCRSVRNFINLNEGGSFYSKYDRPHNINIFGQYKFNERNAMNLSFTFSSGNPITIPTSRYVTIISGNEVIVEEYDKINNYRLPAYHHLDIAYVRSKERKKYNTSLVIGVYNIYNQLNPFMVYIGLDALAQPIFKLRSYLPTMPMLKYHIKF